MHRRRRDMGGEGGGARGYAETAEEACVARERLWYEGEAGLALVGPLLSIYGEWSVGVTKYTHGAHAARMYSLQHLLAVEEEDERERAVERAEEARIYIYIYILYIYIYICIYV